jgi:cytoplasmic iron level regulating protein YaaA (DUF328/UPF0246 family)
MGGFADRPEDDGVLILLPPSEGKADPVSGIPVDPAGLSLPELAPARRRVLDALVELCAAGAAVPHDPTTGDAAIERARAVLGLSPGQTTEVRRNAELLRTGTLPAARVYTGVLYDALDLANLPATAYEDARRSILIFSGLWGVVRLDDRIPPYRCAVGVNLPGIGPLARYWRGVLPDALAPLAADGPVLDLRSSGYAAMWAPDAATARHTVGVRVLHERTVGGIRKRSVVSHFNKATKGRLVRALLTAGARPRSLSELVTALRDLKYVVEVAEPDRPNRPTRLDVIVTEL